MTPYDDMPEIPGMDRLTPEEQDDVRLRATLMGCSVWVSVLLIGFALCWLMSCTSTRYVSVPEVHERWHTTTDTVRQTDSIIDHRTTLIREVDSATMAQYGIQMSALQTAWLIQSDRLQRELSRLRESKTDTVVERDSIPYPVEVVKEVVRPLSWWQSALMYFGAACLLLLIGFMIIKIKK